MLNNDLDVFVSNLVSCDPCTPDFIKYNMVKYKDLIKITNVVDEDMKIQSDLVSSFGWLLALYDKKVQDLQDDVEAMRSRIYGKVKNGTGVEGDKRPTEAHIAALINSNEEYLILKKELNNITYIQSFVKSICRAVDQRGRMLEQLSINQRLQNKTNLLE